MTNEEFQIHVVDALARLDTKMVDLSGNGKPGRVGKLEEDVDELKRAHWKGMGVLGTLAFLAEYVGHSFFHK